MSDVARPTPPDESSIEDTPVTVKLKVVPRVNSKAQAVRVVNANKSTTNDEVPTEPLRITARRVSKGVAANTGEPRKLIRKTDPVATGPLLRVIRGKRINKEYHLQPGENVIGRAADPPVEVDIEGQEATERIWSSRRHAIIHWRDGEAQIEDLQSLNGTFVNRLRIPPGERRTLRPNDVIQVGTIQLRFFA